MLNARSRAEFLDNDIDLFNDLADSFHEKQIVLHGTKGVMNYFHMIGARHLPYYHKMNANLYHYSQQGWEALTQKIKFIFFQNIQHGGQ